MLPTSCSYWCSFGQRHSSCVHPAVLSGVSTTNVDSQLEVYSIYNDVLCENQRRKVNSLKEITNLSGLFKGMDSCKVDAKEIDEQMLLEPFDQLLQRVRKDIWKEIPLALNYWMKIPEDELEGITDVFLMLWTSLITIDDVEDDSDFRYGVPTAQRVYGLAHTINAAILGIFHGLHKSKTHPSVGVYNVIESIISAYRGHGKELLWRDKNLCPSEEQYIAMTKQKAGGYINIAVELMKHSSLEKSDLKPLCDDLGLYIQIMNDYASLKSPKMEVEKGFAEDLSEGKFSFPIIHAIKSHPENNELISILKQKPSDVSLKKHCIEYLESVGSFEYTLSFLKKLEKRITDQIEKLGGNRILLEFIKKVMEEFEIP